MGNKWILDVLADLKAFADANDMHRLAQQLETTSTVAAAELITAARLEAPFAVYGDGSKSRIRFGKAAES
ncbi:hypothetical protein [Pelagovum pacificum]|uniref:Uncharacterized protein n=1 Tax=Pelagovum pacificum TaxID=2588711 RepID=A0A5C5GAC7_9RHOB|nr:hypothetical protein [Pelagovum pacificum]QQA42430.1 hypothetical protein I8N54_16815 [Pelagovum pacificum]TNY31513.1 hypothetical protein FHY64_16005 [Pelagovum pacificum]